MTTSHDITATLAHHVVNTTPDTAALDAARDGVMDFVATALPIAQGAIHDSNLTPLRQVFSASDSLTRSVILGYVGHALDFDDYHPAFRGHPSTVILPALFALSAEDTRLREADFLVAYVIGVEVAGRIGLAAGARHYGLGYHNTATLGAIAAAAAAARLLGASVAQTQNILGLAATQAAGLRAQFGSAVKPLHAGLAARAGLTATKLALAGFRGNATQVLDDFLSSHGDGQQHPEKLHENWGTPWRIVTPGLEFKSYPTCGGTHSAGEAAFALRQQWIAQHGDISSLIARVDSITVAFPPGGDVAPFIHKAATGMEGRFSLEYVIAAGLLEGELTLARFAEGPVDDVITALADKVKRQPDPSAPPDELNPDARFHRVTLHLTDGSSLTECVTRQQTVARKTDLTAKLRQNSQSLPQLDVTQIQESCALNKPGDIAYLNQLLLN